MVWDMASKSTENFKALTVYNLQGLSPVALQKCHGTVRLAETYSKTAKQIKSAVLHQ